MSGMGPNGGMTFPPSWFGGRWTDAEEAEIEARENFEEQCMAEQLGGECCGHPGMCFDEGYEPPDDEGDE
jgi:hypothetical protein